MFTKMLMMVSAVGLCLLFNACGAGMESTASGLNCGEDPPPSPDAGTYHCPPVGGCEVGMQIDCAHCAYVCPNECHGGGGTGTTAAPPRTFSKPQSNAITYCP